MTSIDAELGPWQCKELDHIADVSARGLPWQHHVANRSSQHTGEKCFNAMKVRNALIDACFSFKVSGGIFTMLKKLSCVKATWTWYAKSFQNNHCHCHKLHKWVYQTNNVAFEDLHLALHMIIHLGHKPLHHSCHRAWINSAEDSRQTRSCQTRPEHIFWHFFPTMLVLSPVMVLSLSFTEFPTLNCGSSSRSGSKTGLGISNDSWHMLFMWGLIVQASKP